MNEWGWRAGTKTGWASGQTGSCAATFTLLIASNQSRTICNPSAGGGGCRKTKDASSCNPPNINVDVRPAKGEAGGPRHGRSLLGRSALKLSIAPVLFARSPPSCIAAAVVLPADRAGNTQALVNSTQIGKRPSRRLHQRAPQLLCVSAQQPSSPNI
jgi:hypothetical protein